MLTSYIKAIIGAGAYAAGEPVSPVLIAVEMPDFFYMVNEPGLFFSDSAILLENACPTQTAYPAIDYIGGN